MVRAWEIHPMLVAFPIAFLIGGVVLDLWGAFRAQPERRRNATSLMAVGFWTGLAAAAAGGLAYFTVPAHTEESHDLMLWHLGLGAAALLLFGWSIWARRPSRWPTPAGSAAVVPLVGALLLVVAADLGGHIVFRGGAGIAPSLLAPEIREGHHHDGDAEQDHAHDHDHGHEHPSPSKDGK